MEKLEDILKEYNIPNNLKLDLYERLAILIDKVNKTEMTGIDSLSYLLQLRKILFTENEMEKKY